MSLHAPGLPQGRPASCLQATIRLAAVILALVYLAACAQQPARTAAADADPAPATAHAQPAVAPATALPSQDLTSEVLYEFLLAEVAIQRGNIAIAAQAYMDLAKRTRDPRIAERATEVARAAGDAGMTLEAARIWADTDPASHEAVGTLTSLLVRADRFDEALPYLKRIVEDAGENRGETLLRVARALGGASDRPATLRVMRELVAPYPTLPEAHLALAQVADAAGDGALALEEVRRAAALKPGWELAALLEAQILAKRSSAEAIAQLEGFLKSYPQARDVRLNYARRLVADRRYEDARGEFQKLLADFPDNTDVIFAVAVLSMQLEDWKLAEDNLKRLLELGYRDRNAVRMYLGQICEEQKRYDEALEWYGEVTPGEQHLPAQIRRAGVMAKRGDVAAARAALQQINVSSNQQRVQLILAESQLLRDANQPKEAFDLVEQALVKLPNHPDLLYDHAMLAEKLDRIDILESSLRKLIQAKPDHAHAYNALGYSLADRNIRLAEARELIETALKLSPDDAFIADSMGWVLYRQGDLDGALKYLTRAYALRPDPEIAAHLGEVLWASGRRDEARKLWKDAAAKSPANDTLTKTIQRFQP